VRTQSIFGEEHRLRVFEKRVLKKIFGQSTNDLTGGWRKLHNNELHYLYSLPSIIIMINSRRMKWTRHVVRMVEKRNASRLWVRKPEGRSPLGLIRRRWMNNVKTCLR
jgi:hypothetical protein